MHECIDNSLVTQTHSFRILDMRDEDTQVDRYSLRLGQVTLTTSRATWLTREPGGISN